MAKILKRSSFGLVRTNPKLTTNIKIVADSKDRIYLESIDANPSLSKSIYKGFEVTGGSYCRDVNRFYSQGTSLLPKSIAYYVKENDNSTQIKDRYKDQFDFEYCMGMSSKNSKYYTEEFSLFFPLWVEPENLPDYFVIFKLDNPASIDYSQYPGEDLDQSSVLESLVSGSTAFFDNYVKSAKIIKSFDLTNRTAIGRYIRNHATDPLFPEASIYASLSKGEKTSWNGISFDEGGFTRKFQDIYTDFVLVDKTITESDDLITTGFQNNGIIHPNILNLEFLFDDDDQEKYKFSRYFGLYVSESELGKFEIDGNRLFIDKNVESTQTPIPTKNVIGYSNNVASQVQGNPNGVKIYPKVGPTSGGTSIYEGRLVSFAETQNNRFPYVKDTKGNFYSINATTPWNSAYLLNPTGPDLPPQFEDLSNFLRIKSTKVDWQNFSGFENPIRYIEAKKTDSIGRPGFSFKIINDLSNGDQIRIGIVDSANANVDYHTIVGDDSITAGLNSGLTFSIQGAYSQIASAIAKAINHIEEITSDTQIYSSVSVSENVIVFSRIEASAWNNVQYSIFSNAEIFPFSLPNKTVNIQENYTYLYSPTARSVTGIGNYYQSTFTGGCDNPGSRFKVNVADFEEFINETDPIYVKTDKGYKTPIKYSYYLDEPVRDSSGKIISFTDFDKFIVWEVESTDNVQLTSSSNVALYQTSKNSNGYFTIYPIRDFDFDFLDKTYTREADSAPLNLWEWYGGSSGPLGQTATFDYNAINVPDRYKYIDSNFGPTAPFTLRGFQTLSGIIDENLDIEIPVDNEYDRLKENYISEIALSSRVVPFINKWVYDNESTDVRENPYRLNTDQAFGYSNFSPDFDELERNPKFFTHEWYYLQKYPPYMSFSERANSFSYFDENLYFPQIPEIGSEGSTATYTALVGATGSTANLLSTEEDYFTSYFTRETVSGIPVPREFRYSLFSDGTDSAPSQTLFKGAKVEIQDRSEFSHINYNRESLKLIANPKYNGYRFSSILTYGDSGSQVTVIKNDKWEAVTVVVQADLNDPLLLTYNESGSTGNFIDRAHLYSLKDKIGLTGANGLTYVNTNLSGQIYGWDQIGTFSNKKWKVYANKDDNGNLPNFLNEIGFNDKGAYNNIILEYEGNTIEFIGISNISLFTFECANISYLNYFSGYLPLDSTNNLDITKNIYPNIISSGELETQKSIWFSIVKSPMIYVEGGFNFYNRIINSISFGSIANSMNSGDPEIRYINVSEDGELTFDQFCLDLSRPDYPIKSTYLKPTDIKKKPTGLQSASSIIGYEITGDSKITVNQISRYRGSFNPKWKNLIRFIDTDEVKSYTDTVGQSLDYQNVEIFTRREYANSVVDDTSSLFTIKNQYYNKVNVESPNIILRQDRGEDEGIVYPLLNDIAIDHKDTFLFKSNWDTGYFRKHLKPDLSVPQIGTREPKELKSFFGSKIIAIPNQIRIEEFPQGFIDRSLIKSVSRIKSIPQNIIKDVAIDGNNQKLILNIYAGLSLSDWLIGDGISGEFYKWINPNYSFGNPSQVDDIKRYIEENIFERYTISEVILWEKFITPTENLPQINLSMTDSEKVKAGYTQTKSFQTSFDPVNDLNFSLIYNIPKDRSFSISPTLVLTKK